MEEETGKEYWTRSEIAKLIDLYKSQDCLWNVSNSSYRDKRRRISAWKTIATALGYDVVSVERKMKVLKTQFMHCYKLHKKYSMNGESYQPKWFAYNSLKFLIPGKIYRENREISRMQEQGLQIIKREAIEVTPDEMYDSSLMVNENEGEPTSSDMPIGNTSFNACFPPAESSLNVSNDISSQLPYIRGDGSTEKQVSKMRDEYDIFGELIACRLRKIQDLRSRVTLQYNISNMVFDAEIREIDRMDDDCHNRNLNGM